MKPLNPELILHNLTNGYCISPQDQAEVAQYIRHLQESNEVLKEGMIKFAEDIFELRRQLNVRVNK